MCWTEYEVHLSFKIYICIWDRVSLGCPGWCWTPVSKWSFCLGLQSSWDYRCIPRPQFTNKIISHSSEDLFSSLGPLFHQVPWGRDHLGYHLIWKFSTGTANEHLSYPLGNLVFWHPRDHTEVSELWGLSPSQRHNPDSHLAHVCKWGQWNFK